MKRSIARRMLLPAALLLSGCLDATAPRLPTPPSDPDDPDRKKTGFRTADPAEVSHSLPVRLA